jgi:hypothetical protein
MSAVTILYASRMRDESRMVKVPVYGDGIVDAASRGGGDNNRERQHNRGNSKEMMVVSFVKVVQSRAEQLVAGNDTGINESREIRETDVFVASLETSTVPLKNVHNLQSTF